MEKLELLDRGLPNKEEMTVQGRSQGKGYALTDARVPALTFQTPQPSGVPAAAHTCPCCEQEPREPVFLNGQLVCRTCTSACAVCSSTCLPDGICDECLLHLYPTAVGA